MFSQEPRCIFGKNQLMEVICQLRFPEILTIGAQTPAAFQEEIRDEFPIYSARQESPAPKITGAPGKLSLENLPATVNYQFAAADGKWRVNLTSKFISLACTDYSRWEEFAQRLDKPLAAFIRIYHPAFFERVGLRFINAISRRALGLEGVPFRELLQPCYVGLLSEEDVNETGVSRCSLDAELALRGGCRAKIHAGPGMVKRGGVQEQEVRFILDNDLFMAGNIPVNLSAGAMQTLHQQADSLFRGAVTPVLYSAMEPLERC